LYYTFKGAVDFGKEALLCRFLPRHAEFCEFGQFHKKEQKTALVLRWVPAKGMMHTNFSYKPVKKFICCWWIDTSSQDLLILLRLALKIYQGTAGV